jgi:hypothetical protein
MQKIISFDVGIKNLAYCIFENSNIVPKNWENIIIDWNIINLIEKTDDEKNISTPKCNCIVKTKTCNKQSKYKKGEQYFCQKHAEKSNYILPLKEHTTTFLNGQNKINLQKQFSIYFLNEEIPNTKIQIIEKLNNLFQKKCLEIIPKIKEKKSNEFSLIILGKKIKQKLEEITEINNITHVIIENQISPIASRMTSIQALITQFFIMKNENIYIEYISSRNKLLNYKPLKILNETPRGVSLDEMELCSISNLRRFKSPIQISNTIIENSGTTEKNTDKYKQHKIDSIKYMKQLLFQDQQDTKWSYILKNKKVDDYSDAFLQGVWFIENKL